MFWKLLDWTERRRAEVILEGEEIDELKGDGLKEAYERDIGEIDR